MDAVAIFVIFVSQQSHSNLIFLLYIERERTLFNHIPLFSCKAELTKQQNEFKIRLKALEDALLLRLSSAGGNLLSDQALVENLETTKKTAAEISRKVMAKT